MIRRNELRFADYLKMLPSAWVFEHLVKNTDTSRKILSSTMIEDAINAFIKKEYLRNHFLKLSTSDQIQCALVYLTGDSGIKIEAFSGLNNPLLMSFLVYASYNGDSGVYVYGFKEFEPILREEFCKVLCQLGLPQESAVHGSWRWHCINDITVVASLGAQRLLKKKKTGGLTRTTSLLLKKLTDTGSSLKNEGGDFVSRLLIDFCLEKYILFENETEYFLNTVQFERWLNSPKEKKYDEIRVFVFTAIGGWYKELLYQMLDCPVAFPLSLFSENVKNSALLALKGLRFAGIVELKKLGDQICFIKPHFVDSNVDSEQKKIIILPDFTAVIIEEIAENELYRFTMIGTLQSFDRVYKGAITKTTVCDSLSRGIDGRSVLSWLDAWGAPANVRETVREWLREFYRLYISDRTLLVSSEEKVSIQIETFSPLRSLLEPVEAHTIFQIKKGAEANVKEILQTLGFDYRMPGQNDNLQEHFNAAQPLFDTVIIKPIVEPERDTSEPQVAMRGTKYGAEMKNLDINEVLHVIDYAILTGQSISIDYEGSPYVKPGVYVVKPLSCQKGIEPIMDGEITRTHMRKQFYIKKIKLIGVQP
jgi:hypothetical protein